MDKSNSLEELRQEIDSIDNSILDLLQQRVAVSFKIVQAKNNTMIYRPERETAVLTRLKQRNDTFLTHAMCTPLPNESIEHIWKEIFSCSRLMQAPLSVAFLGPLGTFSHFAVEEVLGHGVEFLPCDDFNDIFMKVMDGQASLGLVPLENSQQGSVGQCLDLFHRYNVNIIAEHYASICQCLLSPETDFTAIETIYSHPQALMQCHAWIKAHVPHAKLVEVNSTAYAAKKALETRGTAALGHEKLLYTTKSVNSDTHTQLNLLAKDISHEKANTTRFVVIAKDSRRDDVTFMNPKTSLSFSLPDTPGALANILRLFENEHINLSKLESRPLQGRIRDAKWQYRFFADANGNLNQNKIFMEKLRTVCQDMTILGIYEDIRNA